jgi:hypothetical protein
MGSNKLAIPVAGEGLNYQGAYLRGLTSKVRFPASPLQSSLSAFGHKQTFPPRMSVPKQDVSRSAFARVNKVTLELSETLRVQALQP